MFFSYYFKDKRSAIMFIAICYIKYNILPFKMQAFLTRFCLLLCLYYLFWRSFLTTFSLHNFRYGIQNNRQDVLRNNKHPEDLGLLRAGLCRCGICGWSMKVHYHNRVNGHNRTHIHAPEYYCRTRNGGQGVKNNHTTTIVIHTLDKAAWKFALRYIKDPS